MLPLWFQYPNTADIAWVTPDQKRRKIFTSGNPGLEYVSVVMNVVDNKAGMCQSAAEHG